MKKRGRLYTSRKSDALARLFCRFWSQLHGVCSPIKRWAAEIAVLPNVQKRICRSLKPLAHADIHFYLLKRSTDRPSLSIRLYILVGVVAITRVVSCRYTLAKTCALMTNVVRNADALFFLNKL
jgi:hypothetical protein